MFTVGNLITFLTVLLIILIYRQIDKGNRSLEKVKKYSDRVVQNLSKFVDEKTSEIKDLSIELQVNLKTGKEMLRRVREVEDGLNARSDDIVKIEKRLSEYDKALKELIQMTGRVDENMRRVHEESQFVEGVNRRIKELGIQVVKLEKAVPSISTRIEESNRKELELIRDELTEGITEKIELIQSIINSSEKKVKDFSTYITKLESRKEELEHSAVENIKKNFETFELEAKGKRTGLMSEFVASIKKLLGDVEGKGKAFTKKLESNLLSAEKKYNSMNEVFKASLSEVEKEYKVKIEEKKSGLLEVVKRAENLEDTVFTSLKEKISGNEISASKRIGELEQKVNSLFKGVENRITEYEGEVDYRFQKLEDVNVDIEELDRNLRGVMERMTEKMKEDMDTFSKYLTERRKEERLKAEEEMAVIRGGMEELDKGLAELKSKAYQDVSEKLQVFEDSFFKDLKERSLNIEGKLKSWQDDIGARIEEIETVYTTEREHIEETYKNELSAKLENFKTTIQSNFAGAEKQIEEFEELLKGRMETAEDTVSSLSSLLKNEVEKAKNDSMELFNREINVLKVSLEEDVVRVRKDVDLRFKELSGNIDIEKQEVSEMLRATRADMTVWQTKVLREMQDAETGIAERTQSFKNDVDSTIETIKNEFNSQRDDLIVSTNEERLNLKNELGEIAEKINLLKGDLDIKTENSMASLQKNLESFEINFQKKINDFNGEVDKKVKDFRILLNDVKEKTEAMQQKLFGKVEENYKMLTVNLTEIERRLKDFTSQTKIFERADNLKLALSADIEELKSEIARLKAQKGEIDEIETQVVKTRKMGEEVFAKLNRFLNEKRRIEAMDGDFKKLLNISKDIDTKLENVTTSHDTLQEIQARIRSLEELEKVVESRFNRLENKKEIIESTIDGVDKNFEKLEKLETAIKNNSKDLSDFTEDLETLKEKMETLAENKDKADAVVALIGSIDGILSDLEKRMDKMQKAREWLAKTETRLEHIGRQAQEQVRLLESLIKEEVKGSKEERGAPPFDKRETVIKLSHQGWSVQEIAKATQLSRGEVELILEIAPKT
ncbi:MAG: hypothetical protein J7K04_02220 [Spirochaetales bacterium]|nr:hypothetical protein [Spirochaetales bacterium]